MRACISQSDCCGKSLEVLLVEEEFAQGSSSRFTRKLGCIVEGCADTLELGGQCWRSADKHTNFAARVGCADFVKHCWPAWAPEKAWCRLIGAG